MVVVFSDFDYDYENSSKIVAISNMLECLIVHAVVPNIRVHSKP